MSRRTLQARLGPTAHTAKQDTTAFTEDHFKQYRGGNKARAGAHQLDCVRHERVGVRRHFVCLHREACSRAK